MIPTAVYSVTPSLSPPFLLSISNYLNEETCLLRELTCTQDFLLNLRGLVFLLDSFFFFLGITIRI